MKEKGLTQKTHYKVSDGIYWKGRQHGMTVSEKGCIRILFTPFHTMRVHGVDVVDVKRERVRNTAVIWGICKIACDLSLRGLRMQDLNHIHRKISSAETRNR